MKTKNFFPLDHGSFPLSDAAALLLRLELEDVPVNNNLDIKDRCVEEAKGLESSDIKIKSEDLFVQMSAVQKEHCCAHDTEIYFISLLQMERDRSILRATGRCCESPLLRCTSSRWISVR